MLSRINQDPHINPPEHSQISYEYYTREVLAR